MTDLEQIKEKVDIVEFISEYVQLKKTGANFKGLCPFHEEKTPSFVVSPERQIWHCFGGCNDGGDVFKFLMRIENIEFGEALKILADRAGIKIERSVQASQKADLKDKIFEINHLAAEFYNYLLTTHPLGAKARDYFSERKISENSWKLFQLGYAPQSWDNLYKFLSKKGYKEEELFQAGLVSRSGIGNVFDRFRGRMMFTLKDPRGKVVGFAGRLLDPDAKEAKYINTAETPVYVKGDVLYALETTKDEIKKEGFVVIVEGEIDAIQSYQAGVRNVVAIKGSALTDGQINLLKRYTDTLYLSLDSDFAGDQAAHRGIETADKAGFNIKVVTFKEAKDPDELIKLDPNLWRNAVKNAVNFYDYIIDSACEKYSIDDPQGVKKIISETAKFIGVIENLVIREHYLKKLADKLNVSLDSLEAQVDKEIRKLKVPQANINQEVSSEPQSKRPREEMMEEYLMAMLLQAPNPSDYLVISTIRLSAEDFINTAFGKIYQTMVTFIDNPKSDVVLTTEKFEINQLAVLIPPELMDTFNRLYLLEIKVDFKDSNHVLEEIQKTVWEVKELSLRKRLKNLSGEIKKNPDAENLEQDFTTTASRLQELLEQKALVMQNSSV